MRSKTVHVIRCERCERDFHSDMSLNETVWWLEDHGWRFQIGYPLTGGRAICDRHTLEADEGSHFMTPHRTRRQAQVAQTYFEIQDARKKEAQIEREARRRKRAKRQNRIKSWRANTLSRSSRLSSHVMAQ